MMNGDWDTSSVYVKHNGFGLAAYLPDLERYLLRSYIIQHSLAKSEASSREFYEKSKMSIYCVA